MRDVVERRRWWRDMIVWRRWVGAALVGKGYRRCIVAL
jgi:hypothetical protein